MRLVHLAPASRERSIRRVGLRGARVRLLAPRGQTIVVDRAVFAMPVVRDFWTTYQWLRELRRWHDERMVAVSFRISDREPVLVAVSTQGVSPALARMVRRSLEQALPARLGELARFASENRDRINDRIRNESKRSKFWERLLEGPIGKLVLVGKPRAAERALAAALARQPKPKRKR